MKMSEDDKQILKELCEQQNVCFDKVYDLLDTVREYEHKNRRMGLKDALRDILMNNYNHDTEVKA